MKTCTKCFIAKQLEDFYKTPDTRDGRAGSCKLCDNERTRAWKAANPDSTRLTQKKRYLRIKYGLTIEQYEELFRAQDNKCACCGTDEPKGVRNIMNVDHDHETGEVRGLLCNPCNVGIGALGDTLAGIERAARYLRRPPRIPKQ